MITFQDLKNISDKGEDYLVDYLNSFPGKDVYEKFKNIMIAWEQDVSYTMGFSIGGKDIKINLYYIIQELENYDNTPIVLENDVISAVLNVPKFFKKNRDAFSIYDLVQKLKYLNYEIDFDKISEEERVRIMDNLPGSFYNIFVENVIKNDSKTVALSNPSLSGMRIDFLTDVPYEMLKGLFSPYGKDYYRDIIYHLSRKIDGQILLNSTMMDIEYFIEKLNSENKEEKTPELY